MTLTAAVNSTHSDLSQFTVKEAQSDIKDISIILDLFWEHYQGSYHFADVYSQDFWQEELTSLLGERLRSFLIYSGETAIAHLAVRASSQNTAMELLLPAVLPQYRHCLHQITQSVWSEIQQQAKREGCPFIYFFGHATEEAHQLATECIGAHPVSTYPIFRPNKKQSSEVVLYYRFFSGQNWNSKSLFVPSALQEPVSKLYAPLPLKREFAAPMPATLMNLSHETFQIRTHDIFPITVVQVRPSLIGSYSLFMDYLLWLEAENLRSGRVLSARVAVDDPAAPGVIELLISQGFRFCGILPTRVDYDYLVFSRASSCT